MLCIQVVREKMRQQMEDDVERSKKAKQVVQFAHRVDNHVTLLKKVLVPLVLILPALCCFRMLEIIKC